MVSTGQSMSATSTPKIALAALVIGVVALALGSYAVTTRLAPAGPSPQTRTFRISVDFYNATLGSTAYTSARFTPDTLTAFEGDTIVFNVTNRDPRPISATAGQHGFTVDGTSISTTVDPGATISQTASNVSDGTYRFYCQLHSAHLSGQLVVLPRE